MVHASPKASPANESGHSASTASATLKPVAEGGGGVKELSAPESMESACKDLLGEPASCPLSSSRVEAVRNEPASPSPTRAGKGTSDSPAAIESQIYAAPTAKKQTSLERSLPRDIYLGQKDFWTAPYHMRLNDAYWAVPFGITTAGLIGSDVSIKNALTQNPNTIQLFDNISNYGTLAFAGLAGGSYLLGKLNHNSYMANTAWLAGEAGVNGFIATYALKSALGRQRPTEGNGQGDFFSGGQSFPSEHATAAWSVATVFAGRYPGTLTKLAMFGGASLVSASRVIAQKHFTSDVFVGSALGYYFGRQALQRYQREHATDALYGTFVKSPELISRSPANMGSPYVPLDSWVYPVFDRLGGMGYAPAAFMGMRPWTRLECARLVAAMLGRIGGIDDAVSNALGITALRQEFTYEFGLLGGERNQLAKIESVYNRFTGISGTPLTDGYHFGQTIYNDFGRPYQEGVNYVAGVSASAAAGPFAVYFRGEYQHAPSAPAVPLSVRELTSSLDGALPVPPGNPINSINRLRIINAYAAFQVNNWEISFGAQSEWWAPNAGGALIFSNNAEPIYGVRISQTTAKKLPILGWFLGPMRTEFMFGKTQGNHFIDQRPASDIVVGTWDYPLAKQPYIYGTKVSLKPTPNLEVGLTLAAIFSGEGVPLTYRTFGYTFNNYSTGPHNNGDRETGFQFSYRIPGLRNWLTLYTDAMAEDETNPIVFPRRSAMYPGIYLSHLPGVPKLDLRVEGIYTDLPGMRVFAPYYYDYHFRNGWTNNGNILGSWIGRQGTGVQAWSTYWLNPKNRIQVGYRNTTISNGFLPGGGHYQDYSVKSEIFVKPNVSVLGLFQYEGWKIPSLATGGQGNVTTSIQLTFWPSSKASVR